MLSVLQPPALITELHGSGAAARRALDQQDSAAFLTSLIHKVATPASGLSPVLHVACLPVLQVRKKGACITCHQHKHAGAVSLCVNAKQREPVLCRRTLCFTTACAQGSAPCAAGSMHSACADGGSEQRRQTARHEHGRS